MTKINFLINADHSDLIVGFVSNGHASTAKLGEDILCSAISSALYLVANTITDVYNLKPALDVCEAHFSLKLEEHDARLCQPILIGLSMHLNALESDYPQNMKVMNIPAGSNSRL